jgi:acetoin utilization deacetylase AcuC-like enzyme
MTAFISHSDCGRHDNGWGHPEHVGRLRAITKALRDSAELFTGVAHHVGRHAALEELALAHEPAYVAGIERLVAAGGGRLDPDTVASEGSWDAARAATGCVLDAVDFAFSGEHPRSFCAVRPPGHHALRDRAMGFCLFGSVGVAAHYALQRHSAGRVLIVDWDVHHGNGTQALVEHTPEIHFVSMHQWPWYPGTGAANDRGPHGTVWNVPLPGGLPRERYVAELRAAVEQATRAFTPDIVLLSAGFDSLSGDPLGNFTLEVEDFVELTEWLARCANSWCAGRLVSALEGGYAPERLAAAAIEHLAALNRGGTLQP